MQQQPIHQGMPYAAETMSALAQGKQHILVRNFALSAGHQLKGCIGMLLKAAPLFAVGLPRDLVVWYS